MMMMVMMMLLMMQVMQMMHGDHYGHDYDDNVIMRRMVMMIVLGFPLLWQMQPDTRTFPTRNNLIMQDPIREAVKNYLADFVH